LYPYLYGLRQSCRLVLSQDGNQRKKMLGGNRQWTATKFYEFGRVIFTGTMYRSETDSTDNYLSISTLLKDDSVIESMTNGTYSTNKFSDATPLTINYYDNYDFRNNLTEPTKTKLHFTTLSPYESQHCSAKGLLTGTQTYYLDDSGNYSTAAMYYDYKGRVVQTRSTIEKRIFVITFKQQMA